MRHYFPTAFQNSSWLHTGASLAKAQLQCCTLQLWWAKALEALSCWSGFKADDYGSEEVCANGCTLRHGKLSETGKWGEASVAYIWNKFQLFKNHIIEQVWNELKPGLREKNQQKPPGFKACLKPTEFLWALESRRHASLPKFLLQTLHSVSVSPSWGTSAFCHQDVENAETYQLPSYAACYKHKKPKLSKALDPWHSSCTVTWNTQFKLLFTKLKTRSKMSWHWLCVFLPRELVGHFRKQRSSFHRGKLIHIINCDPWLCFNTAGCPAIKRKGSTTAGKEVFASF